MNAIPNWARTVIDALADANVYGHGELTVNEAHLVNMASLLLRSRFGDTVLGADEVREVLIATLRSVVRDLDGQEGRS